MKAFIATIVAVPLAASWPVQAQDTATSAPQIDYPGFAELTLEVAELRQQRLLAKDEFLARMKAQDALLLDTRSAAAFEFGHIEGAVNLPFSDFTEERLREVIGDNPDRPIYIYCNNNFSDNVAPVALKKAPLALNIPTFINLVGYGYTNVWELGDVVPTNEVPWVRSFTIAQN